MRTLAVRRRRGRTLLELRLVNRGNVTEEIGRRGCGSRCSAAGASSRCAPAAAELLPHSSGLAQFRYVGRVHGAVTARVELRPYGVRRSYRFTSEG